MGSGAGGSGLDLRRAMRAIIADSHTAVAISYLTFSTIPRYSKLAELGQEAGSMASMVSETRRGHWLGLTLIAIVVVLIGVVGVYWLLKTVPPWASLPLLIVIALAPPVVGTAYRHNKRFSEIEKRLDKLEGK